MCEQYPKTIWQNDFIEVQENGSGGIFISHKKKKVSLRISDTDRGFRISAHDNIITPYSINGLMCVEIWGNRFVLQADKNERANNEIMGNC